MANNENIKAHEFTSENQPPAASKSRKGIPNRATVFEKLLKIRIKVPDPKDPKNQLKKLNLTLHEAMALGQIQSAMKGNTKAFTEIQDSLFGKMTDKTEITAAVEVKTEVDLSKLSTEQLIEFKKLLELANE